MSKSAKEFPIASRPGEYVSFFSVQLSTKEGPAYFYIAVDAYSQFAFNLGVEKEESPENVLKYIYLLTENSDFVRHMYKGFTLVLEKHEELSPRINVIINPVNGKIMINKAYNTYISLSVLRSLRDMLSSI